MYVVLSSSTFPSQQLCEVREAKKVWVIGAMSPRDLSPGDKSRDLSLDLPYPTPTFRKSDKLPVINGCFTLFWMSINMSLYRSKNILKQIQKNWLSNPTPSSETMTYRSTTGKVTLDLLALQMAWETCAILLKFSNLPKCSTKDRRCEKLQAMTELGRNGEVGACNKLSLPFIEAARVNAGSFTAVVAASDTLVRARSPTAIVRAKRITDFSFLYLEKKRDRITFGSPLALETLFLKGPKAQFSSSWPICGWITS